MKKEQDKRTKTEDIVTFKRLMEPRIREVVAELINSSDPKVKRDGVKIYLSIYGLEDDSKRDVLDPLLLNIIKRYFFEDASEPDNGKVEDIDDLKQDLNQS